MKRIREVRLTLIGLVLILSCMVTTVARADARDDRQRCFEVFRQCIPNEEVAECATDYYQCTRDVDPVSCREGDLDTCKDLYGECRKNESRTCGVELSVCRHATGC